MSCHSPLRALQSLAHPNRAKISQTFFKTGKGHYGEGDVFIGVTMPDIRRLVREFCDLSLASLDELVTSPIHEARMLGLLILVAQFQRTKDVAEKTRLYKKYLQCVKSQRVNNWDLVDATAAHIVGAFLFDRPRTLLETMARSSSLWERRVAIVATYYFIRRHESRTTIRLAKMLLRDEHDLIHKAVGWMLREVGKSCSVQALAGFLDQHARVMPRTMLRYAIERLPDGKRKRYRKMK